MMENLFKCCQCKHEINERELRLRHKNLEDHLKVKDRLIKNLECIIDEQEGQIQDLQMRLENQLGIKLIENPENHVLKGISYLSLDFGSLGQENLELKNALAMSEKQNRLLEMRLHGTLFSSTIPISVDDETQTYDSDDEDFITNKKLTSGSELTLNDTGFESEDGGLEVGETESHNLVPTDPIPVLIHNYEESNACMKNSAKINNVLEMLKLLVQENKDLQESYLKYKSETSTQLTQFKNIVWKHVEQFFDRFIQRYEEEVQLRKALHDALVEMRGNIRVFCRVRPILSAESVQKRLIVHDKLSDAIHVNLENGAVKKFLFDRIFDQEHSQSDLFEEICPLIHSCLDGKNLTIFAYGHTGSGKTYSMEIYNEKLRDLLDPQVTNISLKTHEDGNHVIKGITWKKVDNEAKISEILNQGRQNRAVASTALNDNSSRSHAIAVISIQMKDLTSGKISIGKLNLVDLAGSERVNKSQVTGPQLKEAQCINRSLSELGNVVAALRRKQNHVPFRNSLLTRILEDSLAGDGKTVMIVQVTSTQNFLQESLSSMNFAEKISNVTRKTTIARNIKKAI
uniref:Kinesin-like protein n=1 Tax=Acrobeloides nanus TaxID=290746 RepID=A0A914C6C4_9BILA